MSTKISKEELKSPDQVTKTLRQGFVWTTGHSKIVIGAVSAFFVIGIGVSVTNYFTEKKEIAQQEKYFVLEKSYTEKKQGFEEVERAEAQTQQAKKDAQAPAIDLSKKATGDLQKDFGAIIEGFEGFISSAPNSKAAQMAALNLSDLYLNYNKPDQALSALQKVEKGLGSNSVLNGLVIMQLGNVLADKSDCKGAIEKWQTVTNNKNLSYAHDEVKLRMGLCFESLNDTQKAQELYTEVSASGNENSAKNSAASREALKYLRFLKVKKNL